MRNVEQQTTATAAAHSSSCLLLLDATKTINVTCHHNPLCYLVVSASYLKKFSCSFFFFISPPSTTTDFPVTDRFDSIYQDVAFIAKAEEAAFADLVDWQE